MRSIYKVRKNGDNGQYVLYIQDAPSEWAQVCLYNEKTEKFVFNHDYAALSREAMSRFRTIFWACRYLWCRDEACQHLDCFEREPKLRRIHAYTHEPEKALCIPFCCDDKPAIEVEMQW